MKPTYFPRRFHFLKTPQDAACGVRLGFPVPRTVDPATVTCARCQRALRAGVRVQDPEAGPLTYWWPPRHGQVVRW